MPEISIIIPVYNTGEHLERCIRSIMAQELCPSYEIIIVNDGSDNETSSICRSISKSDTRIRLLNMPHGGVSQARNVGIKAARGTYIAFVDSDDILLPDMLSTMHHAMRCVDMAICDVMICNGNHIAVDTLPIMAQSSIIHCCDIAPSLLKVIAGACYKCMYRTDIIKDNDIRFPRNLTLSEDRVFNLRYLAKCQNIRYEKKALYQQIIRKDSATQTFSFVRVVNTWKALIEINKTLYNQNQSLSTRWLFAKHSLREILSTIWHALPRL